MQRDDERMRKLANEKMSRWNTNGRLYYSLRLGSCPHEHQSFLLVGTLTEAGW